MQMSGDKHRPRGKLHTVGLGEEKKEAMLGQIRADGKGCGRKHSEGRV